MNLSNISFTKSEQSEIRRHLEMIAYREQISFAQASQQVVRETNPLVSNALSPGEKKEAIRRHLFKKANPVRAFAEELFAQKTRQLERAIPGIRIRCSPDFEENWVEILFKVKNEEDFMRLLSGLKRHAIEFDDLLRLIRCEGFAAQEV